MSDSLLDILSTPSVKAAQAANGSEAHYSSLGGKLRASVFTAREVAFIETRDSFYMATVSESGWPYVQHRGGPPGFLRVLDEKTLGFQDFRGNRQYISVGNLDADSRVTLLLMVPESLPTQDPRTCRYEGRRGRCPARCATGHTWLPRQRAERVFLLHVEAFDWNCPQHITPRFAEGELAEALMPVRERISNLELENKKLRTRLREVRPA